MSKILIAILLSALAPGVPALQAQQPTKADDITPMQGLKITYDRGQYDKARTIAHLILWENKNQADWPEAMKYLIAVLDKANDHEQAAAYLNVLPQLLDDPKFRDTPQAKTLRTWATGWLELLDSPAPVATSRPAITLLLAPPHRPASTRPATASAPAALKKFATPQDVDDAWMDNAVFDFHCLHGLYMWKQVGGRNDGKVPANWIHNLQGRMHKSGGKYMDEVEGRKGVLFALPYRKGEKPSQIRFKSLPAAGGVLRMGIRAYGFPIVVAVQADGKEILSRKVDVKEWQDLKVALPGHVKDLAVDLLIPEGQKSSEGVWVDYAGFFED